MINKITKLLFVCLFSSNLVGMQSQPKTSISFVLECIKNTSPTTDHANNKQLKNIKKVLNIFSDNGRINKTHIIALEIALKNASLSAPAGDRDFLLDVIRVLTDIKNEFTKTNKRTFEEMEHNGLHECSICNEITEDNNPVELSCGHYFCYKCLFEWIIRYTEDPNNDIHSTCPNCRAPIERHILTAFRIDPRYKNEREKIETEQIEEQLEAFIDFLQTLAPGIPITIHFA